MRDDGGQEYEDDLYEYDAERLLFKRYQPLLAPLTPTKRRRQKIEPELETPPRREDSRFAGEIAAKIRELSAKQTALEEHTAIEASSLVTSRLSKNGKGQTR